MNGKLQITATLVAATFSVGVIWNRISTNAEAMRHTMEQIQSDQQAMAAKIELLLHK
jgi:hypothetical protein